MQTYIVTAVLTWFVRKFLSLVMPYRYTHKNTEMSSYIHPHVYAGEFSAVTAVLTSSVRKFLSLIVSYIVFPKPVSILHGAGLFFVFGAIFAHTW
jgi:hypothetical protein